jgi:hypothetical protein
MLDLNKPPDCSRTPILDAGVMPSRVRHSLTKAIIFGMVIGAGLMELLAWTGGLHRENGPLVFVLLLFVATLIHEIGHLLAGWAVGFRFRSIQIGPLRAHVEYGNIKVGFSLKLTALGLAGIYAPRVHRLRRRLLVFIAGGPAANLLSVPITAILVGYIFPSLANSSAAGPAMQFAMISVVFVMLSLVPFQSGLASDGARIEMLFRSPLLARRWITLLALDGRMNAGVRARLFKQTWLKAATYVSDTSFDAFHANWLAYLSAIDRKDASTAACHLEKCLELTPLLPLSLRDTAALESAVFSYWFRDDVSKGSKWTTQIERLERFSQLVRIRHDVARQCGNRNYESAIEDWEKGLVLVNELPAVLSTKWVKESWLEWREEISQRRQNRKGLGN